ncbi:MAG: type VI secretion system ATPase TssH, partial [Bacteroidetes bacterium]|nr:type VI secretion system ATPase TssH [Bacteroidota bacterium]
MRIDRMTIKLQEVLQEAEVLAREYNHAQIECEHLGYTLLNQKEGVVVPLLDRIGINRSALADDLLKRLQSLPRAYGAQGQTGLSHDTLAVVVLAEKESSVLKDEFTSVEHLLIALVKSKGFVPELLRKNGINEKNILQALQTIRGSQRVTDQNPENRYQVLEKYCRDLTELARREKLDPVIGRDDEIRRVMQVLSRRTKNNPVLIGEPGVGKTA